MPMTKIGFRHQITIPKKLFISLRLREGEILEAEQEGARIVLIPKRLVNKAPAPNLLGNEQKILLSAKEKISKIQKDIINSHGLNNDEINVAVKAGIIDQEQAYWWHEDWQKGERKASENVKTKKLKGPFNKTEDLLASLKSQD